MVQCPECGAYPWPPNFEPLLKQVEGCPACNPEGFKSLPE